MKGDVVVGGKKGRRDCLIEREESPIALKKKKTVKMEDTDEKSEHTSSSLIWLSDFSGHHGTLVHGNGK